MSDEIAPPARGRRRLFQPGQSGNPTAGGGAPGTGRRSPRLDGEALGLTRGAVEAALAGDMLAMNLCLERVVPRCHERPVTFSLPSLIGNGEIDEPSPQNVSRAMNAVTTALACGEMRILRAGDDVEDEDEDIGDAEAINDCDPQTAPADGCRRGSLFNLEEKSSCKFSADAGINFLQMQEVESRRAIRG
jgi:hypothetical protein